MVLVEYCFVVLEQRGCANITLRDFSKAFDCINHGLLIVKPHGYSFIFDSLKFTRSHLFNRIEYVNSFFPGWWLISKQLLMAGFDCHVLSLYVITFKVNNRNTRTRCETRRSGVFIVNFKHISHLVPVFLLLTLNM